MGPHHVIVLHSPDALRRILWAPSELGFGRAYVAGDLDIEGDLLAGLRLTARGGDQRDYEEVDLNAKAVLLLADAVRRLGVIGRPPAPPDVEHRLKGRRHSKARDHDAIAHHYDVGNEFYRAVLGPTMTYSCAYWTRPDADLQEAQDAKHELVCRKLGRRPGMRVLDIGCGWGGMAIHAAGRHGVSVVGITLAAEQAKLAVERVREAGLGDRVEIRMQDYRDIADGPFDAVSSIGMFEHVGREQMSAYFSAIHRLLVPGGRVLNHAIANPDTQDGRVPRRSFIGRYVFPDGELMEVGKVVTAMQNLGFEVRDVESLREHYFKTLVAWGTNLDGHWNEMVALVGLQRARVWKLYMAASALSFATGRTTIQQILAIKPTGDGDSGMAPTREWLDLDRGWPPRAAV